MRKLEISGRTIYYSRFRALDAARRWADHAEIPMMVMMGDWPDYWVVTMADAARLERAGYETV